MLLKFGNFAGLCGDFSDQKSKGATGLPPPLFLHLWLLSEELEEGELGIKKFGKQGKVEGQISLRPENALRSPAEKKALQTEGRGGMCSESLEREKKKRERIQS